MFAQPQASDRPCTGYGVQIFAARTDGRVKGLRAKVSKQRLPANVDNLICRKDDLCAFMCQAVVER